MKKQFSLFILFFVSFIKIHPQNGIDNLIQAEKNFAAYSVNNSTKEAFLKFLDSAGIIFDSGKPVNGIETWNKRDKRPGVLNWFPQYAEIAVSGDFGYTTGPWTFQNSLNDTIAARGQYTTVWHINKNGEWKFLIDLGVNNTPISVAEDVKEVNVTKLTADAIPHVSPIVIVENEFLRSVAKNKSKAYKNYLSAESILNRNGHLPATTSSDQKSVIDATPSSIQYKVDGWGISQKQDMGYAYGTMVINGKTDNYLRIWRKEKEGWKIALEVLRY